MMLEYREVDLPALGGSLAALLRIGDVIGLRGDLGAGKTSLARAMLAALGLPGEAPSPSFAIVQPYAPPEVSLPIWHVDLYRIEDRAEIFELGLDEARGENALLIEWPERLIRLWPDTLTLTITGAGDARRLTASVPPAWETRWPF
jgi:tRNA threonylcarbamoyladenosine biosynthesis protein TsaE